MIKIYKKHNGKFVEISNIKDESKRYSDISNKILEPNVTKLVEWSSDEEQKQQPKADLNEIQKNENILTNKKKNLKALKSLVNGDPLLDILENGKIEDIETYLNENVTNINTTKATLKKLILIVSLLIRK